MYILGISCFEGHSASCLIRDGNIIAAVEEERFSRKKFDASFPRRAIFYCLEQAKIGITDISSVGFYDRSGDRLIRLSTNLAKIGYNKKIHSFSAELSYLAAAFYPAGFKDSALLINGSSDGGVILGMGKPAGVEVSLDLGAEYPLSRLYSVVTYFLGFKPDSDEYKVMGLASFGKPVYKSIIKENMLRLTGFSMAESISELSRLFKIPCRKYRQPIKNKHVDIASSLQAVIEEKSILLAKKASKISRSRNLCLGGSLALNCVANTKILKAGIYDKIWIQPAANQAGGALGAAFLAWHKDIIGAKKSKQRAMQNAFLGPSYTDKQIESFLKVSRITYKKYTSEAIPRVTADLLYQGNIVGWFQGRAEFGPRALGARSILADPRSMAMHERINAQVKFREPFRPLAPAVLKEYQKDYFDLDLDTPYMLFIAYAKSKRAGEIPAVVHVDGSSRIQTVSKDTMPIYYNTIKEFYRLSGCPVVVNTSFNRNGEPIVLSPKDAYNCFKACDIDCLIMGNFLIRKKK